MAGFEYKVLQRTIRDDAHDFEKKLNDCAAEKWRFKKFDDRMGWYIFERGISGRPKEKA
jgi:hypothetical protein